MSAFAISALIIAAIVGTTVALGGALIALALRPTSAHLDPYAVPFGDVAGAIPDAVDEAKASASSTTPRRSGEPHLRAGASLASREVALALALATAVSLLALVQHS